MARFYGWNHQEIMSLDVDKADEYWLAITVLEAQEIIEQIRVIQVPNLKDADFKKYVGHLERMAYPKGRAKARGPELTSEEFAKRIGEQLGKR